MEPIQIPISNYTQQRFKQIGKENQLADFAKFKVQFQNCIEPSQIAQLKNIYLHGIVPVRHNNHIVVIDRVGCIKINDVLKILDEDRLVGYFNQRMLQLSEQILKQKETVIFIIDLKGKIMQLASKKTMGLLIRIIRNCHQYFPNMLQKIVFVNTPMLFDTIWSQLTSEIAVSTQEKIVFLSQQDDISQQVSQNILPQFLGGILEDAVLYETNQYEKAQKQKMEQLSNGQDDEQKLQSLKQALSGFNFGSKGLPSAAQTPLNTEADGQEFS